MNIESIEFVGLARNRRLLELTDNEFRQSIWASGWKDIHHFLSELKDDGATCGILTLADLERAIKRGISEPSRDGKTIHRICGGQAFIVYSSLKKGLITFSRGNPPRPRT